MGFLFHVYIPRGAQQILEAKYMQPLREVTSSNQKCLSRGCSSSLIPEMHVSVSLKMCWRDLSFAV